MMTSVHGFEDSRPIAEGLAGALAAPLCTVAVHRFPDGESLVTAPEPAAHAILVRSLNDPNAKLVELLLAASALRDGGAARLTLVVPYLGYMRQDAAFAPGQAVSQRVVCRWLADSFDAVVTAAPHLHRARRLDELFPGSVAIAAEIVGDLAALVGPGGNRVLLGPDEESEPMVAAVARITGDRFAAARKVRRGDRSVEIELPALDLDGRDVVLIDDVISSGVTLAAAARLVLAKGARSIEVVCCHALFDAKAARIIAEAGIRRVQSCDGVPHPSNARSLAPSLAEAIRTLAP
jgi:ribose-phosphate pyrophosphokinase